MLRHDEATARLKQFQQPGWDQSRAADLGRQLTARAAAVGRAILDVNDSGARINDWQQTRKLREAAAEQFPNLPARERQRLFACLFPRLAAHLEGAYLLFARLPYQRGGANRYFRAPADPDALAASRFSWLCALAGCLRGYDPDIAWVAAWSPYLGYSADHVTGPLLAAGIDAGGAEGDEVFAILRASATNDHEIGSMGRHVTRALLLAARPEGWEFVEKLLLAAQRQEGLRQVILESIDEAHPEAFHRMLKLILERDLLRFSATVRAADVWFGLHWDSATPAVIRKAIEQVLRFLEDSQARQEALQQATGETFYLALWTAAFADVSTAIPIAAGCKQDANLERRFIAVHFLNEARLPAAQTALLGFLDDEDLRIAVRALPGCPADADVFENLERLLKRLPEKNTDAPALVWPWAGTHLSRQHVAGQLVPRLGKRPATALIPWLAMMGPYGRRQAVEKLAEQKRWDAATRDTLLRLIGDRDSWVRADALKALANCSVNEAEAQNLEGLLTRKTSDQRRAVLTLLQRQKLPAVLASADRLLAAKKAPLRIGGLELLRQLVERGEAIGECQSRASRYEQLHPQLSDEELLPIEAVRDYGKPLPTLNDALGLMDPAKRSAVIVPGVGNRALLSKAALACLKSLDDLVETHKSKPVTVSSYHGPVEKLLGNMSWDFPWPDMKEPLDKDLVRLPLRQVWEQWYASLSKNRQDHDGCELLRALLWAETTDESWRQRLTTAGEWRPILEQMTAGLSPGALRYPRLVYRVLGWLVRMHPPAAAADFVVESLERMFALVPDEARSRVVDRNARPWKERERDWRSSSPAQTWLLLLEQVRPLLGDAWTWQHMVRWWQLLHWRDQPAPGVARFRPPLAVLLLARMDRKATDADLCDQLLGPDQDFGDLSRLTNRLPAEETKTLFFAHRDLPAVVDRCRERILEVELARGENPTAASRPARALKCVNGLAMLMRLLAALGNRPLKGSHGSLGRAEVFTHLIEHTFPLPGDTPDDFAAHMKEAKMPAERLLRLGFLAPQWLPHVEHTLRWPGYREAVWWFYAHASHSSMAAWGSDGAGADGFKIDAAWQNLLRERTPLTSNERSEGMLDVDWFRRVYEPLGRKSKRSEPVFCTGERSAMTRWDAIAAAAKYGDQMKPKKACYAADVLLGRVKKTELVKRVREKFAREAVRLLGLLPLARGAGRDADLQGRYRVFLGYRRYARSLSPMGREGAQRDLTIGLSNLARTAGYADPIRLEWAMEAREIADLAAGPVSVTKKGVTVTLSLTQDNQAELSVARGEKPLKSIPAEVRKEPKVAALRERQGELKRQASRIKQSLEAAMCRGDTFTGTELKQLFGHPLLRPLLERLVLVGEGIHGYPRTSSARAGHEQGQALEDHAGKLEPIKADEQLRIAHPHDLFVTGEWDKWQASCFQKERVQPFKQVFRELYVVTAQERADGAISRRYSGQQVNPTQAMALWGTRGWATRDVIAKTFHDIGLVAGVTFRHPGWTPMEVEGWTLDGVTFTRRGEYKPMMLEEVPPLVFSEVMRDCDLVVSVAHRGGVDPEASASTVEMRAALLRETCALLQINNYEIVSNHVLIAGRLGRYSVHLGSAVVHRQPGGSLCILPVGAQHRGRLFLPFADDDPRSAEVLSKVLLLARDHEIQDPSILEQLR